MELQRQTVWPAADMYAAPGDSASSWRSLWAALVAGVRKPRPLVLLGIQIACAAIAWRLVSATTAFLVNVVFPLYGPEQFTVGARTHFFWDALARYDAGWYFGIARNGYSYVEGGRSNLAFFPTYPVSMGYVGYYLGGGQENYYFAGLMISWTAFAGAMVMLYRLARLDMPHEAALRACLLASVFPFAFFYGAVYAESLFLFLSVTTFYAFRRGHWVVAAVAGALVTCTRVNGFLIWPALALLVYQAWRHDRVQCRRAVVALCIVPLGVLTYSAYVFALSGSFLEWAYSIQRWNYTPGQWPFRVFGVFAMNAGNLYTYLTTVPNAPYDLLNGAAAAFGLGAVPLVWRRFGAPYALYVVANLLLPLSSGQLEGLGRYTAVLFPLFLWMGVQHKSESRLAGTLAVFAMFYMLCQALFVKLHPIF